MTPEAEAKQQPVKCLIWDLDHTVWDGILLEHDELQLRPGVADTLQELDRRGILNSISSRNDHEAALVRLSQFGIAHYFLCPEIGWRAKSESVGSIAKSLNIGTNALAFVDDQPFEREEVAFVHPDVLTIDAVHVPSILTYPRFQPRFITSESRVRRQMYQQDFVRQKAEQEFQGRNEEFLRTLGMVFTISRACEADLQRAEELTLRTNQLNTTGYTYSYSELDALRQSDVHLLLIASLDDKFGSSGAKRARNRGQ
jgi:FkbH-like protein